MPCEVLAAIPDMCGAQFSAASTVRICGQCSRARGHSGDHFDATFCYAWSDGASPRPAWLRFDAADLTLHFECDQRCHWRPRPC
jgi:hypothetical protein